MAPTAGRATVEGRRAAAVREARAEREMREWEKQRLATERQQLEHLQKELREAERAAGIASKFTSGRLRPEELGAAAAELSMPRSRAG